MFIKVKAHHHMCRVKLKAQGGRGASQRWCRKAGLQEQRLFEMAKLRSQFQVRSSPDPSSSYLYAQPHLPYPHIKCQLAEAYACQTDV